MAIAVLDDVMLREPRLLVPGMQPLGPVVVNYNHQLVSKMLALFMPGIYRERNLINNEQFLVNATSNDYGVVVASNSRGRLFKGTATSSSYLYPKNTSNTSKYSPASPPLTIFSLALVTAGVNNFPIGRGNGSSSSSWYLQYLYGSSDKRVDAGISCTGGSVSLTGSIITTTNTLTAAVASFSENGSRLVIKSNNNIEIVTGSATSGAISNYQWNDAYRCFQVGGQYRSDDQYRTIFLAGMATKEWSEAECISFVNDPYQFLIPA